MLWANGKMRMCGYADIATGKLWINFAVLADVTDKMRRCGFLTY